MARTFALLDHKCPELEKLLEENKVSFEWFVCCCSPIERQYQILEDEGEWKNIDKCPFCGAPMWVMSILMEPVSLYPPKANEGGDISGRNVNGSES